MLCCRCCEHCWLGRCRGRVPCSPSVIAEGLKDLDVFPSPAEAPDYYVDYGETGPFVVEVGDSECAV